MKKCCECGALLPCVNNQDICKECDDQFNYCYSKCKNPCRTKEEQVKIFNKLKPEWRNV